MMDFDFPIGASYQFAPGAEAQIRKGGWDFEKWDKRFLRLADEIASWSKDPSTQIGTVVVDPNSKRILSTGYNGFPRGMIDSKERYDDRETKYKFVVHGEANAIYNATWNGVSLNGATIYTTGLPTCSDCAKGVIQVGIKRVVCGYPEDIPEKWVEHYARSMAMFKEAGLTVTNYHNWK